MSTRPDLLRKYADILSESRTADFIVYKHPQGDRYPHYNDDAALDGTGFDENTLEMDVPASTTFMNTHKELLRKGWKRVGRLNADPGSHGARETGAQDVDTNPDWLKGR